MRCQLVLNCRLVLNCCFVLNRRVLLNRRLSLIRCFLARYRTGIATVVLLICTCLTSAAPDFNTILSLAKQRYSDEAVEMVSQWQTILGRAKSLPESEQLPLINQFFNGRIFFGDDQTIWGKSDYWATPLETMGRQQGDCEDFTIAKYISLRILGVPNEKLRLMYVKARISGPMGSKNQAHMVLAYYPAGNTEPLILDNLISIIKPASERTDLTPVFGFNSEGLWVSGSANPLLKKPETRLSRWRDLLSRMQQDGFQ
jgi:predicted transglutaminase-like cysteine proteinase